MSKEDTYRDYARIGKAIKQAFDECGIKSITPLNSEMFIGYQDGNLVFNKVNIKTIGGSK